MSSALVQRMESRPRLDQTHRKSQLSQALVVWLLLIVLLVSFGLRVHRLGDESVWYDEGYSTWLGRQSFVEIAQQTSRDTHPPFYYGLLHLWRGGSGDSEFGLRYLSAIIGVLTVAVTYCLGLAIDRPKAGLLAALLVGISRFHIWWSQEVRMYALAALLATLTLWAAVRLWDRGRLVNWALYVLFATAGLYSLYLGGLVVVVVNLTWLWVFWRAKDRRAALIRWVSAQVAILLLFAPWLIYALDRIPTWSAASSFTSDVFVKIYWAVLATGIPVDVERYSWLAVSVLVVLLAGLVALLWTGRRDWRVGRNVTLLLLCLLLPTGVVYLLSLPSVSVFYTPPLAPRYLVIFAPAFYVLLAWGITRLGEGRRWPVGVLATAVVMAVSGYGLWQYYADRILLDDYKALVATLRAHLQPDDAVVLHNDEDWPVFAYHHPGSWRGIPNNQRMTPEASAHLLSPIWNEHEGVWLVVTPYAGINDPQGTIPAWLEARAIRSVEHDFTGTVLRLYARTETRSDTAHELASDHRPPHSLSANVGSGLRLIGYEQPVREYRGGDTIHLFLYWEQEAEADERADGIEVSLVDKYGHAWQRAELPWPTGSAGGGPVRQQADLLVPPDVPDGAYTFAVRARSGSQAFRFGEALLRQPPRAALVPTDQVITRPQRTDFDDGVRLLGYDLNESSFEAGDSVLLTLYWEARQPVAQRYKVFTHLLGDAFNAERGNFLWGQQDNEPVRGTRATTSWRPGELIVDDYAIALDPETPSGRYAIEIGLYEPATGERLPILDDEGNVVADHLILIHVIVESTKED